MGFRRGEVLYLDEEGSHTVLSFQNLQGESPVQTDPGSGTAEQKLEAKVSRKQLPLVVTGVSRQLPKKPCLHLGFMLGHSDIPHGPRDRGCRDRNRGCCRVSSS